MAVINFDKNGQGYYDFDALLNETSEKFVRLVQHSIERLEKTKFEYTVKIDKCEIMPTVYIKTKHYIIIYRYIKETNDIQQLHLGRYEVLEMADMFND